MRKVQVLDYNDGWPSAFETEAELIRSVLGAETLAIFHIGSTAVPGLKAKPVIYILPVVVDIRKLDSLKPEFAALGYEGLGELGLPGRRFFRKGGDRRSHHVHAYQYDNCTEILRHLAFRDYLRAREEVRLEYGLLKASLAARHSDDMEAYMDGKDAFVKKTERAALSWWWRAAARKG